MGYNKKQPGTKLYSNQCFCQKTKPEMTNNLITIPQAMRLEANKMGGNHKTQHKQRL